ncbi:MAG: TauD/TfdA family dioxygenase [Gammaproteobacteria bacterium]|nr:TauD/TfdA family dioxygenase [Gammaproteobacteria bacterium]MCY4276184.1 TauD/TfdA family dioxygenase [Gammaproteobacteria bacterium]
MTNKRRLQKLSPVAGIEVEGMDLASSLTSHGINQIKSWLDSYQIVVFRDQYLSREAQSRLTSSFGPLEEHKGLSGSGDITPSLHIIANIDSGGNPVRLDPSDHNLFWHIDKSYLSNPVQFSILHALETPKHGGDTQFANLYLAYNELEPKMKERLVGLRARYTRGASKMVGRDINTDIQYANDQNQQSTVSHPLIHTHPSTGRKLLFLDIHADHIEGQPQEQGLKLLKDLLEHATQEKFIYTHNWLQGDVVIWDNRCLLHRAIPNFAMTANRRILRRSLVRGFNPIQV